MNDLHRQAEALAGQATTAAKEGRPVAAEALFAEAANLELRALKAVPQAQERTRGVLAVSGTALLYKARRYEEAEMAVFRLLGAGDLNEWAVAELRELLEVVSDERLLETQLGRRYSGTSLTVSLRGGEIGSGTGPLDVILNKATGFKSLLYRFAEWIGDYPLRVRGAPPQELQDLIQARATEPAFGSYRMEIRLTEPTQQDLFRGAPVDAREVSDAVFEFFDCLNRGSKEDVEAFVPDVGYRKALLELSKSVAPSGRRVKEVGLFRTQNERVQRLYLTSELPAKIKETIPRPTAEPGQRRRSLRGILRALHLDNNWLEITLGSGEHVRCDTLPDMLDDVVGPMVNNEVIVEGVTRIRRGRERLLVEDIDLAGD